MLTNILAENIYVSNGTAALYALIGFLVVFAGISFLILVVWAVGKIMAAVTAKQKADVKPVKKVETVAESLAVANADDLSDETVAVITAALMAYYQAANPKCEFTVKRIKRI